MTELSDELLDRMVDRELSAPEERELLARLDGVHDGWRRLALAYVEGQALRDELSAIAPRQAYQPTHAGRSPLMPHSS